MVTLPPDYGLATPKLGADNLSVFVKPERGLHAVEIVVDKRRQRGRLVLGVLQRVRCDGGRKALNQRGTGKGGLVAGATGTTRTYGGRPGGVGLGRRRGGLNRLAWRATTPRGRLETGCGGVGWHVGLLIRRAWLGAQETTPPIVELARDLRA